MQNLKGLELVRFISVSAALLVSVAANSTLLAVGSVEIQLTIDVEPVEKLSASQQVAIILVPLRETSDGTPIALTKSEIFAATQRPTTIQERSETNSISVPPGKHAIFAFADTNNNGKWDPAIPESLGWFSNEPSGRPAAIDVNKLDRTTYSVKLTAPHPLPTSSKYKDSELRKCKDYTVVHLKGDAESRGLAHGHLLASQIIDFFRFYILEDKFKSAALYEKGFARFLHSNFRYPTAYQTECEAVIEGMQESGTDLRIPELNRDFCLTDLYAINGYIETRAMRSSCTQFAAWGNRTKDTDVAGGMITGRNMDGEIDLRKTTVSHFVLFAVEPSEPGQKRYVSMMWPGFVATISGINEDGFYAMENAGLTGPGEVVQNMVHFSWTMREALAKFGSNTTPKQVQTLVDSFDNSSGGACGPGCITLFATPYSGQSNPAYILEGDRFGDAMRCELEAFPKVPQALLASNHHRKYGVSNARTDLVFGKPIGFSSRWRYEAGSHHLNSWFRQEKRIGTPEMRELLQAVAHGTTEYSIITRPNAREFDVAVASMEAEPWDAPYRKWTTFQFEELFSPSAN